MDGHSSKIEAVALSSDSRMLASASFDSTIKLWNAEIGALSCKALGESSDQSGMANAFQLPKSVMMSAFSPNGRLFAIDYAMHRIDIWDTTIGAHLGTVTCFGSAATAMAFSPDGSHFAAASRHLVIRLWEAQSCRVVVTFNWEYNVPTVMVFSGDGQFLAAADHNRVKLWSVATHKPSYLYKVSQAVWSSAELLSLLPRAVTAPEEEVALPSLAPAPSRQHRFAMKDKWLTCDSRKFQWVPHEYRSADITCHNATIALPGSGKVIFLAFDFANGGRWEQSLLARGA